MEIGYISRYRMVFVIVQTQIERSSQRNTNFKKNDDILKNCVLLLIKY